MAASIGQPTGLTASVTEDEKERLRLFGMRVRLLRTVRQWSQEDLAHRSGISR